MHQKRHTFRVFIFSTCLSLMACSGSSSGPETDSSEADSSSEATASAQRQPTLPNTLFNYANITLPDYLTSNPFPASLPFQHAASDLDNTPIDNPITDAGATLGRVLFYDTTLSANGTVACASCHLQEHGFSDPAILSVGFNQETTRRHSMGLANSRFYATGTFFWDERADTLEDQVLMPFQDPVEMGLTLFELEELVNAQDYYAPLFLQAFGSEIASSDEIARALAQFVRSIVSVDSKYDRARQEVDSPLIDFPGFTAQENVGKRLFFEPVTTANGERVNCSGCHISEAFVGPIPNGPFGTSIATNNGLDASSIDDQGVFESTGNPNDTGKFQVPSLKNIAIRAPYMHDGRFSNLDQVIEHYSSGIQDHPNLSPQLRGRDGQALQFGFSNAEKSALIAFLNTLTDESMMTNERYSDPFN